mgnify:CR=1 FL=1
MPYSDLNRGRFSSRNQICSITTVTRNRVPVFSDFSTARLLVADLRRLHDTSQVRSLAWVVMPDHLHWLFQLVGERSLSRVIADLKGRTSRHIGARLGRRGGIWQRAYYDRGVRSEEDIRGIANYIVANPLRAGLVERVGDYPHWDCVRL